MANTQQKLELVIEAQNKAGAALNEVNNSLTKVGEKTSSLAPMFGVLKIAGVAAFAAVAVAIKQSVDAAMEAEKVQAQLAAVLKSTGGAAGLLAEGLNDQAKALQRVTTFNDEAVNSSQALLLTFTNIKGAVFQEAIPAILDMATAMGTDLKGASIQVGKALNDPIEGINALRRVGVSFNEDQRKVIESLVNTGKTAEAQRLILAELNKEFGGSASAAAQTFGGRMEQVKNQLDELKETIGVLLLPILEKALSIIGFLVDKFADWASKIPSLTEYLTGFLNLIEEKTGLISAFKILWEGLGLLWETSILPSLQRLWLALEPLGPVLKFIAQVAGVILVAALYTAIAVIKIVAVTLSSVLDVGSRLASSISGILVTAWKALGDAIQWVIDKLKQAWEWMNKVMGNKSFPTLPNGLIGPVQPSGRASGGSVQPGRTFLVGERGPEWFTPDAGGRIGAAGAGGGITINIAGPFYGDDAGERIGDDIMRVLKQTMKL